MDFKHAIVREVSPAYPKCRTSHPNRHEINHTKAQQQHAMYVKTLQELGLEVIVLPALLDFPDSCFVEDTVVLHRNRCLVTRLGIQSRRGEEAPILEVLKDYKEIGRVTDPGTIEGGDVIHLEDRLISGLSQRTNEEGVKQASDYLQVPIDVVEDPEIMHLKSYVTYLGKDMMVTTRKYHTHPVIEKFDCILVEKDEEYAANTLTIGDTVLLPKGHPSLKTEIHDRGFDVIELEMNQFELCEGALTCLSIRF